MQSRPPLHNQTTSRTLNVGVSARAAVMPHLATNKVRGDANIMTMFWKAGSYIVNVCMLEHTPLQEPHSTTSGYTGRGTRVETVLKSLCHRAHDGQTKNVEQHKD